MDLKQLKEDCRILGIEPESTLLDVERAYQEKRNLYDIESLATYSLFDDEDRHEKLNEVQGAYQRVLQHMAKRTAPPPTPPDTQGEDPLEEDAADADMNGQPGGYLRQLREKAGLSIRDVAERTKIGPFQLENIEDERFDKLPAPVYLRGFVLEFARMVGAPDPAEVAGVYIEHLRKESGE